MKPAHRIILLIKFIVVFSSPLLVQGQPNSLVYPTNGLSISDTIVTFTWNKNPLASKYIIQLSSSSTFSTLYKLDSSTTNSITIHPIYAGNKYYWRVRSYTSPSYSAWSTANCFKAFTPKSIDSLVLWLDPDSGIVESGGKVSYWYDISGKNYDVSQSVEVSKPSILYDTLSGHNLLRFENGPFLVNTTSPLINYATQFSFCAFLKMNTLKNNQWMFQVSSNNSNKFALTHALFSGPSSYRYYYSLSPGANNNLYYASVPFLSSTEFILYTNTYNGSGSIASGFATYHNGVPIWMYYVGAFPTSINDSELGFSIGATNTGTLNSDISLGDIIMYRKSLPDSIRGFLENHIMDKYAPPVSLGFDTIVEYGFCSIDIKPTNEYALYSWSTGETTPSISVLTSGYYSVSVTDFFGRSSLDTIFVSIPTIDILNTGLCLTDTLLANTNLSHAYDFLWNDASTDSLLEISAAGTYWVEITDSTALHCSVRDSFVVVVDSFPITANLGADRSLCQGDVLELIDGELSAVDYLWSNGETTESIVVNTAGEYSLTVINNNACLARDTLNIDIAGFRPLIGFDFNNVCSGSPVAFVDTSVILTPDGPATWLWIFGDGDSAQVQNPQHIFPSAGDFPVLFQLTTDSGCKADTLVSVHVYRNPSAYFTPVQGCSGQNILFFDESSSTEGFLNGYQWAFDDPASGTSNSSMIQNPYHAFTSAGDYNVQMIVQTNLGCYDTLNRSVHIKQSPEANFNFTTACEGNRVYFADITDVPVYEQIIKTIWHFGDGNTSSYASTSNLYGNAGMYDVTLIVQSLNGCYDTVVQTIAVHPVPVADFVWSNPCFNQSVEFVDNSTIAFDNIIGYNWTFAELGQASSNPSFMTFPGIGDYDIALTVTSDFGCTDSIHKIIKIYPIPTAIFMVDPEYGIPPLEVQLYNQSIGGNTYLWNFGDGGTAVTANPTHIYYGTDIYDIWLIVANEYGCTDSTSQVVYVIPGILDLRIDAFYVADSLGEYHMTVDMTNQGTRNIREIVLEADVSGNIPAREHWEGLLLPGQSLRYNFVSGFISEEASTHQYLCVNVAAENTAESDATPENNVECYSLSDDFNIIETYPNPANESAVVSFYLPEDGNVEYTLTSSEGKLIEAGSANELEAGVNRLVLATFHLAAGTYTLQLRYIDVEVSTIILIGH